MRRVLMIAVLIKVLFSASRVVAQDIPLFSQKLTNSFIYNPALAGHSFGSLTYSFKQNYSGVEDSPQNHLLSIHTPIANHRFGIGANVYEERVTFLHNTYASGAFAYHLSLNKLTTLSFGVSAELNSLRSNGNPNFIGNREDEELERLRNGIRDYDFSFGAHFQNRYLKIGVASNRLAASWIKDDAQNILSGYYSAFAQALLPLRNKEDLLEPYIAYRKFSDVSSILDMGIYYTYNNKITAGAAFRSKSVLSATLAFRLSEHLLLGYSREMITGNVAGFVGAANEFTIRLDFRSNDYKKRFRADYTSSVAYRRKTLSHSTAKTGARGPKQARKKQKKLAPFSPNNRYQNIKKLSIKTKKHGKKRGRYNLNKRKQSHYKKSRR
jgi:type IX secretion system PorP/SprF family membrane protein